MNTQLWGLGAFRPHRVLRSVLEVQNVSFDYVICANKIVHSSEVAIADAIRPAVRSATVLVSLQNGINVEQPLRDAFARNTVLSAICYVSCQQTGPGLVQQVSQIRPHAFHIGAFDHGSSARELKDSQVQDLVRLDAKFKEVEDIKTERWTKMIFNGSWNSVAALTGCDTHQILQNPLSLAVVQRLAAEIFEVAVKSGARLPRDLPLRTVSCAASTPSIVPSMLQDVLSGRKMEVEAICGKELHSHRLIPKLTQREGNAVRQARMVDVSVPTLKATYDSLLRLDRDGLIASNFGAEVLVAESDGHSGVEKCELDYSVA